MLPKGFAGQVISIRATHSGNSAEDCTQAVETKFDAGNKKNILNGECGRVHAMSENTDCGNADKALLEATLGFHVHIGQGQVAGHTDQECTHCWRHTESKSPTSGSFLSARFCTNNIVTLATTALGFFCF